MFKISLNTIIRVILAKENRLYLYLFFVVVFIGFLSTFANKWSSTQPIDKFIISGNTFIPTEEILSNVDSSLVDCIREDVEFIEVKDKIIKHPFILTSFIMQKKSSVIEIEVKERFPIAIIVKNDGRLCYTDKYACILPYRLSLRFGELPIIRNVFTTESLDTSALTGVIKILAELEREENEIFNKLISEIEYNSDTKSYSIITSDKAYSIYFGKADNVSEKVNLLCDFLATRMQELNVKKVKYIDIRWDGRVIVQCNEA